MTILRMKFRPASLCWFLANRCADDAFARDPSIPRKVWLLAYLPKEVRIL